MALPADALKQNAPLLEVRRFHVIGSKDRLQTRMLFRRRRRLLSGIGNVHLTPKLFNPPRKRFILEVYNLARDKHREVSKGNRFRLHGIHEQVGRCNPPRIDLESRGFFFRIERRVLVQDRFKESRQRFGFCCTAHGQRCPCTQDFHAHGCIS